MAILSVLLSFIGRKLSSLVQAIFGWSVTALFGRLPRSKQLAVTLALVVSIAWPIFVVGLFRPAVAGWVLAILPLEAWFGKAPLRVVWTALAVASPPIVGWLVHSAAPSTKGSAARAALGGYRLAIGFFGSFVVTAVTVPLVRLASILRGWSDDHVYVQALPGAYRRVVHEIAEACARAGLVPEVVEPPARMMLATNFLGIMARSEVSPIVAEELLCVRAKELELFLYPSDLLVRGKRPHVARVRAMLMRTDVEADAYLVGSDRAQTIQDQLRRLLDVVRTHERAGLDVGRFATQRLVEVWRDMNDAELSFDEWVMLESLARRIERRIVVEHFGRDALPLDRTSDALSQVAEAANARERQPGEERSEQEDRVKETRRKLEEERPMKNITRQTEEGPLAEASTTEIVKEAFDETKELLRLELEIAKNEARIEMEQVKVSAISMAIAASAAVLVLCMIAVAIVLALGGTAGDALAVGAVLLVLGAIAAFFGYSRVPKKPFENVRHRVERDVHQLKEHVA